MLKGIDYSLIIRKLEIINQNYNHLIDSPNQQFKELKRKKPERNYQGYHTFLNR